MTTGDDYWTLTSANQYRAQLHGDSRFLYRANCDHNCSQQDGASVELYTANAELMYRISHRIPLPPEPQIERHDDQLLIELPQGALTGFYVDAIFPSQLYHDSIINRWILDRTPYRRTASRFRVSSAMTLLAPP